MRRIALFSDVHGNLPALEAVLADVARVKVTERYCLGDLVGYGPDPAGVVALVRASGIPTVQGNYDDGVGNERGSCGCYYATDQARADGDASYAFTVGALSAEDKSWLAGLPWELRLEHAGARALLVHGSPRKVNEYLMPDRPDSILVRLAEEAEADAVCVGHVHVPYHRLPAPGVHYVSSGSVGKPKDGDARACWVELLLGQEREFVELGIDDPAAGPVGRSRAWLGAVAHRVDYDVEAVAAATLAAGLPPTLAEALRSA